MKEKVAMMQREIHVRPEDMLRSLHCNPGDFGPTAIISGQAQRAKMCLEQLQDPVKNFSFLGYTFWTGSYRGKKVTVGNGGLYAPDAALINELLCAGGVNTFLRLGSCGALRKDISIGDYIIVTDILRGDGTTRYYIDDTFTNTLHEDINLKIEEALRDKSRIHRGRVWTTDALFKETRDIVNSYIEKGAIAVDMITSSFVTVANVYHKKVAVVLAVSDNLITGELGFASAQFVQAEQKLTEGIFDVVEAING